MHVEIYTSVCNLYMYVIVHFMQPAFDAEFPDDDLFPEVMVQAATKFNLLCLAWKNKMTVAQATVNAQGKVLQAKIAVLNAVIKAFRTKLKVLCQKKCGTSKYMVCVCVCTRTHECVYSVSYLLSTFKSSYKLRG